MLRLPTIPRGKDLWAWPPFTVLLALAVIGLGLSATRVGRRAWDIHRERQAVEARIRALEAEKIRLAAAIEALSSAEAVERLAKGKLNLKQPGEEVVVVVPEHRVATTSQGIAGSRFFRLVGPWFGSLIDFFRR